jgi:glucan endo-1,3-alpha-glucosidase
MFISMDMNVLPSSTPDEAQGLVDKVAGLIKRDGYLRYRGKLVLSTFGGHDKVLGGWGWEAFLRRLEQAVSDQVSSEPSEQE